MSSQRDYHFIALGSSSQPDHGTRMMGSRDKDTVHKMRMIDSGDEDTDDGMRMMDSRDKDTVVYYIEALRRAYGDNVALHWKGSYRTQSFTYEDIYDNARRFVTLLRSRGIDKGDRVCIWADNSPSWIVCFFGCLMSGIVLVPIDFGSRAEFAEKIIARVRAKAILLSTLKILDSPIEKLFAEDLLECLADVEPVPPDDLPDIRGDDLIEIVFTSGTTSDPKGVLITNRNLVSNIRSMRRMMLLDSSYTFLSMLPLSHLLEQVLGLFYPLRFGATIIYTKTRKSLDVGKLFRRHRVNTVVCVPLFLEAMRESVWRRAGHRGRYWVLRSLTTVGGAVPFRVARMLSYPVRRGISPSLRLFICGGSKLDEKTEDFWMRLGIRVLQGYGLTEASPVVSCNTLRRYKAHTVGRTLPGQEIRIADDGEILVRGKNVTSGYYEDEGATKNAFERDWYKTGDIGDIDNDGYLTIVGRKKEMILSSAGANIFPRDIERVLDRHPCVKESCVVGLEENGGMTTHAAVIPEPSCTLSVDEIVSEANEKLSEAQRIHAGSFWAGEEFPKTALLKIKKHEVAAALRERRESERRHVPGVGGGKEAGSELLELLATFLRIPPGEVESGSRLVDDLGLDSLRMVELVVALEERFSIGFDESNLTPASTVADLEALIECSVESAVRFPELSWARTPVAILARDILQRLCTVYLRTVLGRQIRGRENLSRLLLPVIFVANHTSHLDTPAILWSLPSRIRRRVAVAAAADYFFGMETDQNERVKWSRRGLAVMAPLLMNAFPFCRKEAVRKSLSLMGDLLDDGWSVLIYPEGTRSITGEIAPFRPGIGLIAGEMLAPVVPVKLRGLFEILPKGKSIPRRGTAQVIFGAPVAFEGEHDHARIAAGIEDALRAL